ncbi:MAG: hypothetical protein WAQ27_06280 [Candidatus Microsaccharimonas sp.]
MGIKQTAGKILLSLYVTQLDNPVKLERASLVFKNSQKPKLDTDRWLKDILHSISENDTMLYNGFNYLLQKGLIGNKNTKGILGGLLLLGLHVTSQGVDVVEGVEQGPEQQKIVKSLFSFNFSNNVTVDSLVKAEIGNVVGIGAAVGGKLDL